MDSKIFLDLVIAMREAQRNWYNTHDFKYLGQAKKLEKRVDEMITQYQYDLDKLRPKQMELNFPA